MKTKLSILAFASVCLITGCDTTQQIRMPDGSMGYEISCGGAWRSWGSCLNEAAQLCNGKYAIVDRNGSESYYSDQYGLHTITKRKLMVVCK